MRINRLSLPGFFVAGFVCFVFSATAQIAEHPLEARWPDPAQPPAKLSIRADSLLKLPFADDFSGDHPYPDAEYWEDHQVFVNNNLPLNPPSIGVATFDGLNQKGLPYGGGYGGSDTLTSRPFALENENQIYLSYFLQPKGIGFQPELVDSFVVEGLDREGSWRTIASYEGLDPSDAAKEAPEFQRASHALASSFLHDGFQVRFRNYSSNRGLESLWHLDYVMMTRENPDRYVEDIGFVQAPGSLLRAYTSYPLSHLRENPDRLNDELPIMIRNNSRDRYTIDSSQARIVEVQTGTQIFLDRSLLEIPPIVSENQRNIDPGTVSYLNNFNNSAVKNYILDTDAEELILATEYDYVMREERNLPAFEQNNHVRRETVFDNYLAYDDHSVESAISTYNGMGITSQIAVEYELEKADSLQSVRILFPYMVRNYEDRNFNLLIFVGELKEEADYVLKRLEPVRGSAFQPFTEYRIKDYLEEGILLPAGKVYVGWEHPRGTDRDYIPFGFDKNNPDGNRYIYSRTGGDWFNVAEEMPNLKGAVAMRLVVGQADLLTNTSPAPEELTGELFPNPATSEIYLKNISTEDGNRYEIYNIQGQLCAAGRVQGDKIDISGLNAGYFVLVLHHKNGRAAGQMKFIKQ